MQPAPMVPDPAPSEETFAKHLEALLDLRHRLPASTPSDLKRRLTLAIQVAASPTCPESQPDGVPCGTAEGTCDHCARALRWIETVREELETAVEESGILRRDPRET